MPRRDGTGPMGYGPYTGRGYGCCGPKGFYRNQFSGYYRPGAYDAVTRKTALQEQLKFLEEQMEDIRQELQDLNK